MDNQPLNLEAHRQKLGRIKGGLPVNVFEKLPFERKVQARWLDKQDEVQSRMPSNLFSCVLHLVDQRGLLDMLHIMGWAKSRRRPLYFKREERQ